MSDASIETIQIQDPTLIKLQEVCENLIESIEDVKSSLVYGISQEDLNIIVNALRQLETSLIDILRPLDAIAQYPDVAEVVREHGLIQISAIKTATLKARETLIEVDELDDSKFVVVNPNIFQAVKNNRVSAKFKRLKATVVDLLNYIDGGTIPGFKQISGDIYPTKLQEIGILARINQIQSEEA